MNTVQFLNNIWHEVKQEKQPETQQRSNRYLQETAHWYNMMCNRRITVPCNKTAYFAQIAQKGTEMDHSI
jgi:hypothetical protein